MHSNGNEKNATKHCSSGGRLVQNAIPAAINTTFKHVIENTAHINMLTRLYIEIWFHSSIIIYKAPCHRIIPTDQKDAELCAD